jgi:2-polyprenyl-3-methyl-5-hydroxy-6-metoxy-1,4-benzoquinol methylase
MPSAPDATEALAERVLAATIGLLDLAAIHLGERLGLYRALRDKGPATSVELAARTGADERYLREWLEQQAVTGILTLAEHVETPEERRYALPPAHARALADADDAAYIAPLGRQALGMLSPLGELVEAYRTGRGVPYSSYGPDTREGIGESNRVMFLSELGSAWFPAIPDVHRRLASEPGARVADLGCGLGWSSIAIARAYPSVRVDGYDSDEASIEAARANAAAEGLGGRVRFVAADASELDTQEQRYELVTIFVALHDMGRPVEALAGARRMLAPGGSVIVADPRVADRFSAPGDELERLMYGFSVVHCLAVARADAQDSAATGTVMRPDTLRRYAEAAGLARVEVLEIENDFWRFYRLGS